MPTTPDFGTIKKTIGYSPGDTKVAAADSLALVVSNILGFLTLIAGLAFIFYFIIGAVNWITSAGDPKKLETARTMILNAFIGLIITLIAYPLLSVLSHFLGFDLASPADLINQFHF